MRSTSFAAVTALACVFAALPARAKGLLDFAVGAKGFAGGNLWTTPSNIPGGYDGLGFAGSAGGFGYGFGAFVEGRIVKFVGVEVDALYDSGTLQRDVTYRNAFGSLTATEKVTITGLRIPVLFKGVLPLPGLRLWAGVGPEFMTAQSASASLEPEQPGSPISAKAKSSTNLALALGLVIELPASLELPIDLRASKNLSQESAWADRVAFGTFPNYAVTAQSSWDFRFGAGLGYAF